MANINNEQVLSFDGFVVTVGDLPDNSVAALLALGFSTKIKNAVAGVKAGVLGTSKDEKARWSDEELAEMAGELGLTEFGRDDATANAIVAHIKAEMFESIKSGIERAGRTARPRLSPEDKLRREIAIEKLEAFFESKNAKLPRRSNKDEREAFETLLANALAKPGFAKDVENEFKARIKARKATSLDDAEMADLLG